MNNIVIYVIICILILNYISFPVSNPIKQKYKLPPSFNNPIDNILVEISNCVNPLLYTLRITPNTITIFSFLFVLLSMKYLYNDNYWMFCIFYILSYWFDCIDGNYARTYGLTSKLGDWLDHMTDIFGFLGILIIVVLKYSIPCVSMCIFFISLFLLIIFVGCQEKYSNFDHSDSLYFLQRMCPGDPGSKLKVLRFNGFATFQIITVILIYFLQKKSINK